MIRTPYLKFNEKILITGAKGMLGHEFLEELSKNDSSLFICTDIEELDITNDKKVKEFFELKKPSIVINCAGYTEVDNAETKKEIAYAINVLGPTILTDICRYYNAMLIHFSTDQVFDGTLERPLTEKDEPNPLNYYAETKLLGEKKVLQYEDSLVLRLQWLYSERKNRFFLLKNKEYFYPFSDQFGAPTWTKDVVSVVFSLIEKRAHGLFHFSYDDYTSWEEVFRLVKEKLGLPVILEPKKTHELRLPAKRPLFTVLSNKKLSSFLGIKIGSWKESFFEFLGIIKKELP